MRSSSLVLAAALAAGLNSAAPGWTLGLRLWVMSGGSQPISSSRPTAISRSAACSLRMKLGFASTKCGSW